MRRERRKEERREIKKVRGSESGYGRRVNENEMKRNGDRRGMKGERERERKSGIRETVDGEMR